MSAAPLRMSAPPSVEGVGAGAAVQRVVTAVSGEERVAPFSVSSATVADQHVSPPPPLTKETVETSTCTVSSPSPTSKPSNKTPRRRRRSVRRARPEEE